MLRSAFLFLVALLLAGCATSPHEYPELAPPHAAAIEPLRSERVVVGSSSGSVVAALYAGGYNAAALEEMALRVEDHDLIDFTLFGPARVQGEALQDYVNRALGNRSIEALERSFAVIATERATSRMTVFNRGNTGLAVRASSSIPNVFWPVIIAGTKYVDGGLTSRVPVPVARRMGAQVVIAVDVSWRGSQEVETADVVIRPATPRTRTLDFSAKLESIAAGEAAARAAMPAIRERIAQAELTKRQRGLAAALH